MARVLMWCGPREKTNAVAMENSSSSVSEIFQGLIHVIL